MEKQMKIDTIGYTEKFNKGNYESVEVSFNAALSEGESAVDALHTLKNLAHNFFHTMNQPQGKNVPTDDKRTLEQIKAEETAKVESPKAEETKKAAPSRRKKAEVKEEPKHEVQDGQEVPPVIPTPAAEEMEEVESPFQVPKGAVMYDLTIKDHRDRFAAYLTKTYPTWKTKGKEFLLAMSNELSGKAFEDGKGVMLDSFKNIISGYFE
jgi:hypothetical protein